MKGIITCVALLCATSAASYSTPANQISRKDSLSTASPLDSSTILIKDPTSSSSTEVQNAENTAATEQTSSISTINLRPDDPEIPVALFPSAGDPPRRRIITYDQRQEGQYNIRADLENFMIVMVPQDTSLFSDLFLMKALRNRPNVSKDRQKTKNPFNVPNFLKFRELTQRSPTRSGSDDGTRQTADDGDTRRIPDFIEGRTPYHVDISASNEEQSRLHPDRQVDVLPPPYPLAYQHLKPYHLEAEPTVIQALPPPEIQNSHISGNFLETYNNLMASGLKNAAIASDANFRARYNNNGPELGYYRLSRAIRGGGNALDTDRSNALNNVSPYSHTVSQRVPDIPIYRIEHSLGAASLYPPIDVPKVESHQRRFEYLDTSNAQDQFWDDNSNIERHIFPTLDIAVPQDDIELELNGVSLLDRSAKTLLSDGMERCAPGHRRDSYGLCREIQGY